MKQRACRAGRKGWLKQHETRFYFSAGCWIESSEKARRRQERVTVETNKKISGQQLV